MEEGRRRSDLREENGQQKTASELQPLATTDSKDKLSTTEWRLKTFSHSQTTRQAVNYALSRIVSFVKLVSASLQARGKDDPTQPV